MADNTIALAVKWYNRAYKAIGDAGGYPYGVIQSFPNELIETLIRNGIHLVYINPLLDNDNGKS